MILKKGQVLDLGDPLHLRIKKCADIQHSLKTIDPLLLLFTKQFQDIHSTQIQILEHLKVIYGTNSSYSQTIGRFCAFLEQCLAIGIEECADLGRILQQNKKSPVGFADVTDAVKEYFESDIKFQRQQKKISEMKVSEKTSGCMATSKGKKYRKAQQVLEDLRAVRIVKSERVVETSNKMNGVKYEKINPATQHFFNVCLLGSIKQLRQLDLLRDYEEVLRQKENPVLVDQYFMDLSKFRLQSQNEPNRELDFKKAESLVNEGNASSKKTPLLDPSSIENKNRTPSAFARDPIDQSKHLSLSESIGADIRHQPAEISGFYMKSKVSKLLVLPPPKKNSEREIQVNKNGTPLPERQFMVLKNVERENVTKSAIGSPVESQFKYREKIVNNVDSKGNVIDSPMTKTTKDDSAQQDQRREINPFISAINKNEARQKSKEPTSKINQATILGDEQPRISPNHPIQENKGLSKKEEELLYKLKIKSEF